MIIVKKRIMKLEPHFGHLPSGTEIILVAPADQVSQEKLTRIGFDPATGVEQSVLPSCELGPVSRRNAEGYDIVHRGCKMEEVYRTSEWHWTEWHGRDRIERSEIVDVPYRRYPRTFVPPQSVELTLQELTPGTTAVTAGPFVYSQDDEEQRSLLRHSVNLMLEAFGSCQIHGARDKQTLRSPIRRLNWVVLPPGVHPWPELKTHVTHILETMTPGCRALAERRLETIVEYGPDFTAFGHAGFSGYIAFGFEAKDIFVLESTRRDNATYVFGHYWERLSRLTKAEILSGNLHEDRIIHRANWFSRVEALLN